MWFLGSVCRRHTYSTAGQRRQERPISASSTHPGSEEEVEVLVQQRLVAVVPEAEVLQKLVRQPHHLVHPDVVVLQPANALVMKSLNSKTTTTGSHLHGKSDCTSNLHETTPHATLFAAVVDCAFLECNCSKINTKHWS